MVRLFVSGGPFMVPLLVMALAVAALTVRNALKGGAPGPAAAERGPFAILFWGMLSLVTGFLAHWMGMYSAMDAISHAGKVEMAVAAAGYGESLVPLLFGMWVFVLSAVAWFTLRWRQGRLLPG